MPAVVVERENNPVVAAVSGVNGNDGCNGPGGVDVLSRMAAKINGANGVINGVDDIIRRLIILSIKPVFLYFLFDASIPS